MGVSTFLTEQTALQRYTGDTSTTTLAVFKQALNDSMHELCEANDWEWLRVRGSFDTVAAYTTGLITIVDSTTDYVTTTGTWSTGWSPMRLRTAGGFDYLVTYNSGNSRWELDRDYGSLEVGVTYTLYKDTYALPVRMRSLYLGWGTSQTDFPLRNTAENTMLSMRVPFSPSTPVRRICMVEPDTTNYSPQAQVDPIPSVVETVFYRGFKRPLDLSADADTFPFPGSSAASGPVLAVFRQLARSKAFEYRGMVERADNERSKYEAALGRLVNRDDPSANAQMAVRLDEQHFRTRVGADDGFGDSAGYYL